jgi:hypothetical protein
MNIKNSKDAFKIEPENHQEPIIEINFTLTFRSE